MARELSSAERRKNVVRCMLAWYARRSSVAAGSTAQTRQPPSSVQQNAVAIVQVVEGRTAAAGAYGSVAPRVRVLITRRVAMSKTWR